MGISLINLIDFTRLIYKINLNKLKSAENIDTQLIWYTLSSLKKVKLKEKNEWRDL